MKKQRSNEELADLIARRRKSKSEETKQKIREGNQRFWASAKEAYLQEQLKKTSFCIKEE